MNIESFLKKKIRKPRPLKIIRYEFSHTTLDHDSSYRSGYSCTLLKFRPHYEIQLPKSKRLLVSIRLDEFITFDTCIYHFTVDDFWKYHLNIKNRKDLLVDNISDLKKVVLKVIKTYLKDNPEKVRNQSIVNLRKEVNSN